jgi:hypothetical protein
MGGLMAAANAPPALFVSANGVGVLSDSNLNSLMQTGALAANLRAFTGLQGMTVWLIGISSPSDGGQGMFMYSSAATAADDNENVIAPSGALQGRWLRQSGSGLMVLFGTIAALRASTAAPPPSAVVYVEGYYVGADGGEGMFWHDAADTTSADNGGTIIVDAAGNRWYRERNKEALNIFWFGIHSGGDSAPALNAALAALPTGGGEIAFQPYKHTFNSAITYTYPSAQKPFRVSFTGSGENATILYWPASNGITLNTTDPSHTFLFRDMTLTTGAPGLYTGISVNQSANLGGAQQSEFVRITLQGDYPTISSDEWGTAIAIKQQSFVSYDTVVVNGNSLCDGVTIVGNVAGSQFAIQHVFSNCFFQGGNVGITNGDWLQGVFISQTNFTNGVNGIVVSPGATAVLGLLTVSNCQFNTKKDQISVASQMPALIVTGSLFFVPQNYGGISTTATGSIVDSQITGGNQFAGPNTGTSYGIFTNPASGCGAVLVTGNNFSGLSVGVQLGTATFSCNVQANVYNTVTTKVVNNGTSNSIGLATD